MLDSGQTVYEIITTIYVKWLVDMRYRSLPKKLMLVLKWDAI